MPVKTYVLLENMDANAPVYRQLGENQRQQIKKIPFHRPTLRQDVFDAEGNGKVIRYKSTSKTIDQSIQIEKEKIEANARFTTAERRDLEFRFGVLTTAKAIAQEYVEAHPECEGSPYTCDEVNEPRYKLLDEAGEAKIKNTETRKRIRAAGKVDQMSLEEAQELLLRLNGSFFQTPATLEDCQNLLWDWIDDTDERGLEQLLNEEATVDETTTILIGKLINGGLLSFDQIEGKISKKDKAGKWAVVRDMSAEYSLEERKRLFSDFLNSTEGKLLKADLEKDVKSLSKNKNQ